MRSFLIGLAAAACLAACGEAATGGRQADPPDGGSCASLPARAAAVAAFEAEVGGDDAAALLMEEWHLGFSHLANLLGDIAYEEETARLFRTREALEGDPAWPAIAGFQALAERLDPDAIDWSSESLLLHGGWAFEDRYRYLVEGDELVIHVGRGAPCLPDEEVERLRTYGRTVRALRIPAVAGFRFEVRDLPYAVPEVRAAGGCAREPDAPLFRSAGMTGAVAQVGEGYRLWFEGYSAMSGNWFSSTSPDGIDWTPGGWDEDHLCTFENHSPYAGHFGPSLLQDGTSWAAWYAERSETAGPLDVIAKSTSDDGIAFTDGVVALRPGAAGSWDDTSVSAPSVLAYEGRLWMWYSGSSTDRVARIGLAISDDDGATWSRHGGPVLEPGPPGAFDELGVGGPEVRHDGERFHLWYEASAGGGNPLMPWRVSIGHAVSDDGVHWTKDEAPVLVPERAFEAFQLRAPSVSIEGAGYRLWYSGIAGGEPSIGHARCTF